MAKDTNAKGKKRINDWSLGVPALFIAVLIAYLPILFGMGGQLSSFQPDIFFAIVVVPVSLACLLCGLLALLTSPRPSLLVTIGLAVLLLLVFVQLCWVVIAAALAA
jgi:hypothetical protein